MKDTGYVRRLDQLGRIVLPKKVLEELAIDQNTPLEIYAENGDIRVRPYVRACAVCGGPAGTHTHHERPVCEDCRQALRTIIVEEDSEKV